MLRTLIIAIVTLLLVGVAIAGTAIVQENHARESSEKLVREIYESWDYETVRFNAIDQMRNNAQMNEDGPRVFKWGGESLGTLERVGGPQGGASIRWGSYTSLRGLYAAYSFDARFSKGEARLDIELLFEDGEWRIAGTKFNSPQLAERMAAIGKTLPK